MLLFESTSFGTTFTVSSANDSGVGSLREQILSASAGDTITFSSSINGQAILLNSQISLNKELVIQGNGVQQTILDGSNGINFRLLSFSAPCIISGIKFQNGGGDVTGVTNTGLWGGAVNYNFGGSGELEINDCKFVDNKAYLGGAIRVQEGSISISKTSFVGNESFKFGGAINTRNSGTVSSTITNCIFYQNATSERGGAIYSETGNNLTIANSTFVENSSGKDGGGLCGAGSVNTVTNCIFYNNTGSTGGNDISSSSSSIIGSYNLLSDFTGSGLSLGLDGNISGDPDFVSVSTENFRIKSTSAALNTGDPLSNTPHEDFYGFMRVNDGRIDIGAAEFAKRFYVNENATGLANGSTWADAYTQLESALTDAVPGTRVWTAKGTYKPSISSRYGTFNIPDSVKVFGGFSGTEPNTFSLSGRDFEINKTILSGDIGTVGDSLDNSYNVVTTRNVSKETVLDGFTIRDGNANFNSVSIEYDIGGGWYNEGDGSGETSNPIARNIIFENNNSDNAGGGMGSYGVSFGEAGAIVENCIFRGNRSKFSGGGLYFSDISDNVEVRITNVAFAGNRSGGFSGRGGGLYISSIATDLDLEILNCSFVSNAARYGGAIYGYERSGSLNLILKNSLAYANGASQYDSDDIRNTIDLDNASSEFFYSFVEDNTDESNGNLLGTLDPLVFNAPNAFSSPNLSVDFRVIFCSPLINAGTNTGAPTTDVFGKTRLGLPDIGAFEFTGIPSSIIYVDDDAGESGSGSSWEDAVSTIQDAQLLQSRCIAIDTIWVAKGVYYPTESADRNLSFSMVDSTKLFGGFEGVEPANYDLSLRNFSLNESLLSGDINVKGDSSDNSYHVVRLQNVGRETLLDGFTISHGHSTGAAFSDELDGAGILNDGEQTGKSSPTIRNCVISNNYARTGAGLYNNGFDGESSPLVEYCSFINNVSTTNGAGLYNNGSQGGLSNTIIRNSRFSGNSAGQRGASIYNNCDGNCELEISGSLFSGNFSKQAGAGLFNTGEMKLSLTNCTFASNYSDGNAAGIYTINNTTPVIISNSIFWQNYAEFDSGLTNHILNYDGSDTVAFSMFEGVFDNANGNLPSVDPLFVEGLLPSMTPSIAGDFSLKLCSPVTDKGINDSLNVAFISDLAANPRIINGSSLPSAVVDLGAYEYQGNSFLTYVNVSEDINTDIIEVSSEVLEAESTVFNPAEVLFHGENHVLLKVGFEAGDGAVFTANAGPFTCPN